MGSRSGLNNWFQKAIIKIISTKISVLCTLKFTCNYRTKKPVAIIDNGFAYLAVRTRLELATSCVTGRHSNRLNYRTRLFFLKELCFELVTFPLAAGHSNRLNYRTRFS